MELIASIGRDDSSKYAEAHQAIIDRFGRFPHRNMALRRASTPEEIAANQIEQATRPPHFSYTIRHP